MTRLTSNSDRMIDPSEMQAMALDEAIDTLSEALSLLDDGVKQLRKACTQLRTAGYASSAETIKLYLINNLVRFTAYETDATDPACQANLPDMINHLYAEMMDAE